MGKLHSLCAWISFCQDLERREGELNELHHLLEKNHTAIKKWKTEAVERAKVWVYKHSNREHCSLTAYMQCMLCVQWERYMRCDGVPDPAAQCEINTYMHLWRDDSEVNIKLVLEQCNLALQVCMRLLISDGDIP